MGFKKLQQLVSEGKVSIFFIYGTVRSGTTISEVIFSRLSDRAINQPFRHMQAQSKDPEAPKDAPFERGCELIVEHCLELLKTRKRATITVKEVALALPPEIWHLWIQIPDRFLFSIREPHAQFLSSLSILTDIRYAGGGKIKDDRTFVLEHAASMEDVPLDSLVPATGTVISDGQRQYEVLKQNFDTLRESIRGTSKRLAVMDLSLLQAYPDATIASTLTALDVEFDDEVKSIYCSLEQSQNKVFDEEDPKRITMLKARTSKALHPLKLGDDIETNAFPPKSQAYIRRILPIYLELLYAPEHAALPTLEQLKLHVAQNKSTKLEEVYPFMAYLVARYHAEQTHTVPHATECQDGIREEHSQGDTRPCDVHRFKDTIELVDQWCFSNLSLSSLPKNEPASTPC